ncbi:MAG: hypothetical protein JWM98_696 [Thermoleophilia bacterium]|nr:hypothetical protein [Thermoleophilia bacterium]
MLAAAPSTTPPSPAAATPLPWSQGAGRGGNHLPANHPAQVGDQSLRFSPRFSDPAYHFAGGTGQTEHGVELLVETGSAPGVLDGLRAAVAEVPQSILDGVRQVRVLAGHDEGYDRYYEQAYGIPGFHAVAAGGGGAVNFFGGRPYAAGVLFHELGHSLPVSGWGAAVRADDATIAALAKGGVLAPVEFEPIPDPVRRARWTPRLAPGAVTPYGGSATGEDIAESLHLLLSETHFGHAFATVTPTGGTPRPLTFGEAYPARTAVLERAARSDLDHDGTIGA